MNTIVYSEKEIKCVCWDFDYTILTVHTGGIVQDFIGEDGMREKMSYLASQVSPSFIKQFVYFFSKGVKQCVVTFGDSSFNTEFDDKNKRRVSGDKLVKMVFEAYVQKEGLNLPENVKKALIEMVVFGFLPDWRKNNSSTDEEKEKWRLNNNKNIHLEMSMKTFNVNNSEIILIDDDLRNINCAKASGFNTIHVSTAGYTSFCELV